MNTKELEAVALSVRSLSMDAIQKANSGHPGLPLGCAELAAVLYGEIMNHNPKNSSWKNRDRFVLSAGHGSMLLYSILHLSGYKVTMDDIKSFRQIGSHCAGHPEYGITDGVETTTGPLGQGFAMAVGLAMAESMLAAKYNTPEYKIVDHYTYTLMGEGCLMEGISSEASSLAGSLKLGKLIAFYDENKISIDGSTDIAFTEDVAARYTAYGWQVLRGSMYNMEEIVKLVAEAKKDDRPSLIILKSTIGQGAPTVAGTAKAHGAPLGVEGIAAAKANLGIPADKDFYVAPEAYAYFEKRAKDFAAANAEWDKMFDEWSKKYPEKRAEWDADFSGKANPVALPQYKIGDSLATRAASGKALNVMAQRYKSLVGGSADLQGPNVTKLEGETAYSAANRGGRYIHFGIREFAMAAICNGIQLHGGLRTFCATFMVFSDYLRPALRLSALMNQPVVYIMTHDSIYVGEDGPTHQPIETLAAMRAIPNTKILRPGDAEETAIAWEIAMESTTTPSCLALTRQNLAVYTKEDPDWQKNARKGAYVVLKGAEKPDVTVLATGSEVNLALDAAKLVTGKTVRVVSVLDREEFIRQDKAYQDAVLGNAARVVTAEAGVSMGWEYFAKNASDCFAINRFGESGPAAKVAEHLGFTAANLAKLIQG